MWRVEGRGILWRAALWGAEELCIEPRTHHAAAARVHVRLCSQGNPFFFESPRLSDDDGSPGRRSPRRPDPQPRRADAPSLAARPVGGGGLRRAADCRGASAFAATSTNDAPPVHLTEETIALGTDPSPASADEGLRPAGRKTMKRMSREAVINKFFERHLISHAPPSAHHHRHHHPCPACLVCVWLSLSDHLVSLTFGCRSFRVFASLSYVGLSCCPHSPCRVFALVVPCLCRGRPRSAALRPLLLRDEARDPFHALARLPEQLLRLFRRQPRERAVVAAQPPQLQLSRVGARALRLHQRRPRRRTAARRRAPSPAPPPPRAHVAHRRLRLADQTLGARRARPRSPPPPPPDPPPPPPLDPPPRSRRCCASPRRCFGRSPSAQRRRR